LDAFDEPLPTVPTDPPAVLDLLDEAGSPAALAANWLTAAWDQNSFDDTSSPAAAKVEEVALRWLLDVLRLPPAAGDGFVTGATMANFSGLAAAAPNRAHLVDGCDRADSWATDAHKWLNVPYDCGLVFCRRPQHLAQAMSATAAAYLPGRRR